MSHTVSVIIPFFKNIGWLDEALQSVFSQSYPVYEILLIDDGSEENVKSLIESYENYHITYYRQKNSGPAAARNKGIELSTGEYIAFLDSDDVWLPNKLEKQIASMSYNDSIWSHTSYETFLDNDPSKRRLKNVSKFTNKVFPEILASCPIATPCVIVIGDILRNNKSLRFNDSMRFGQDTYLWIYLAMRYDILTINETLTKVRIRGTNAALQANIQLSFRGTLWERVINIDNFPKTKIPLATIFGYKLSFLGSRIINYKYMKLVDKKFNNLISKILYLIPWLLFRINKKR